MVTLSIFILLLRRSFDRLQHSRHPGHKVSHNSAEGLRFFCRVQSHQRLHQIQHDQLLQVLLRATGGRVVWDGLTPGTVQPRSHLWLGNPAVFLHKLSTAAKQTSKRIYCIAQENLPVNICCHLQDFDKNLS